MTEISDESLMTAFGRGDANAFDTLYARYRQPLYTYLLRHVGEPAAANDLFQGVWEKIIRARQSYSNAAPFRAWAFRIARNHLVDHYRRSGPATEQPPESLAAQDAGPEELLQRQTESETLEAAILALPAEQRDTLLLKLEGRFDLETIAGLTGVNPETAKSRLRYAMKKLRDTWPRNLDQAAEVPQHG